MKLKTFIAALGFLLVAGGIIFGSFVGVSVAGPGGDIQQVDCGTPWGSPDYSSKTNSNAAGMWAAIVDGVNHDYGADCSSAKSTRQTVILFTLGIGVVLVLGGLLVRDRPVV